MQKLLQHFSSVLSFAETEPGNKNIRNFISYRKINKFVIENIKYERLWTKWFVT
jgi:hypothetical protein